MQFGRSASKKVTISSDKEAPVMCFTWSATALPKQSSAEQMASNKKSCNTVPVNTSANGLYLQTMFVPPALSQQAQFSVLAWTEQPSDAC